MAALGLGALTAPVAPPAGAIAATWLGTVGSTSARKTQNLWNGFSSLSGFAVAGTTFEGSRGYGEGKSNRFFGSTTKLGECIGLPVNPKTVAGLCCTDGTLFYRAMSGSGGDVSHAAYVEANRVSDHSRFAFSAGSRVSFLGEGASGTNLGYGIYPAIVGYDGVCSLTQRAHTDGGGKRVFRSEAARPWWITGLAVQRRGPYLAVARRGQGMVQFYHKTTGAYLGVLRVPTPGAVAFDAQGGLWVVTGAAVRRYTNAGPATAPDFQDAHVDLPGLVAPLAVAVSPLDHTVAVADGGAAMQLKGFSPAGALRWTYGQAGGNRRNPAVTTDRFHWVNRDYLDRTADDEPDRPPQGEEMTFLTYGDAGDLYVSDRGNFRTLHLAPTRAYLGQIAWVADVQHLALDRTEATHLFVEGLQMQLDYRQLGTPSALGDQSQRAHPAWKTTFNWSAGLPLHYGPVVSVCSYTQAGVKRTYGLVFDNRTAHLPLPVTELVELRATGPRLTGIRLSARAEAWVKLYPEGLRWWALDFDTNPLGTIQRGMERRFSHFDDAGNPVFGPPVVLNTLNPINRKGPGALINPVSTGGWGMGANMDKTDNGTYISYLTYCDREASAVRAFHLAGIKQGQTAFAWRTLLGTLAATPVAGHWPENPDQEHVTGYGGHRGVGAAAVGGYVISWYDGQFGRISNQRWLHDQNGRFLLQYGKTNDDSLPFHPESIDVVPAGYPNNIAMACATQANGVLYDFTSDEGVFGGACLYAITGLNFRQALPPRPKSRR